MYKSRLSSITTGEMVEEKIDFICWMMESHGEIGK